MILRKAAIFLHIAALSISMLGATFSEASSLSNYLSVVILTFSLIFIIYGFNDLCDYGPKNNENDFLSFKKSLTLYFVATLLLVLFAFKYLPIIKSAALCSIIFLGISYSLPMKIFNKKIKIKNIFIVKNIYIGLGWALLVLLGSGTFSAPYVLTVAAFVFIQVFIGSIMRDMDDLKEDKESKTESFPIRIGIRNTKTLLYVLNLMSLLLIFLSYEQNLIVSLVFVLPVIWRHVLLSQVQVENLKSWVLQEANLFTCVLIFISRVGEKWIM